MKEVVRSVKDGSKIVKNNAKDASKQAKASYKSVKSKLKDSGKDDSSSTQSAPSSPTLSRGSSLSRAPDSAQNSPAPGLTRNNTDLNLGSRSCQQQLIVIFIVVFQISPSFSAGY